MSPGDIDPWPNPRFACLPFRRCAYAGCVLDRAVMRRGDGVEVARRFCWEHAVEYDAERCREDIEAPVYRMDDYR